MTDTTTATFTLSTTREELIAHPRELLATVREQWLDYARLDGQPMAWARWMAGDEGPWVHPGGFTHDLGGFHAWARQNPERFTTGDTMTTTAVPSGDTIAPIDQNHPGWDAFWERLAEHAEEDGYQAQYNILAAAFGAVTIDDERTKERDFDVEVRVDSFYVTVSINSTREAMEAGDYDIDQTQVDDAIRSFIRNENVDYSVENYEEV